MHHLMWEPHRELVDPAMLDTLLDGVRELAAAACPGDQQPWLVRGDAAVKNLQGLLSKWRSADKKRRDTTAKMVLIARNKEFARKKALAAVPVPLKGSKRPLCEADEAGAGGKRGRRSENDTGVEVDATEVESTGLTDEGAAPELELSAEEADEAEALLLEKGAASELELPEKEEDEDGDMLLEVEEGGGTDSARSTPEARTSSDPTATPTPPKGRRSLREAMCGMNGSGTVEDSVVDDQTEEMNVEVRGEELKLTAAEAAEERQQRRRRWERREDDLRAGDRCYYMTCDGDHVLATVVNIRDNVKQFLVPRLLERCYTIRVDGVEQSTVREWLQTLEEHQAENPLGLQLGVDMQLGMTVGVTSSTPAATGADMAVEVGGLVSKVTAIKERCVITLVPHNDAASLADLIRTADCNPKLRIYRVDIKKPIEAILKHCRSKWRVALGDNVSRLVFKAPEEKGGSFVQMNLKVSELLTQMSLLPQQGALLEYMLLEEEEEEAEEEEEEEEENIKKNQSTKLRNPQQRNIYKKKNTKHLLQHHVQLHSFAKLFVVLILQVLVDCSGSPAHHIDSLS
jgi:hypothetical protein